MADLWLADYECDPERPGDGLPGVCMVCGEAADGTVRRTFRRSPPFLFLLLLVGLIGLILLVVLMLALGKRMRVDCPVCDRHRGHWWKGNLLGVWLIVCGFAGLVGGFVVARELRLPAAGLGGVGVLLVGLVAGVVVSNRLVRPLEITDRDIRLANLSDEFAAAVRARRAARGDREDD